MAHKWGGIYEGAKADCSKKKYKVNFTKGLTYRYHAYLLVKGDEKLMKTEDMVHKTKEQAYQALWDEMNKKNKKHSKAKEK